MNELPWLLARSRQGASAHWQAGVVSARQARPSGPGVQLQAQSDGEALLFWVPESDWCHWLAPQLPLSSLSDLAQDWQALAAGWTLSALDDGLQAAGLAPCRQAGLAAAVAPDACLWCLCLRDGERRLPLYVQAMPADGLAALLASLQADPACRLTLSLGLGWCLWPPEGAAAGELLALHGTSEAADVFWLEPWHSPGRVQLLSADSLLVLDAVNGLADEAGEAAWLAVEVGQLQLAAPDAWPWTPGQVLAVQAAAYPLATLSSPRGRVGQGSLWRFDDGWGLCLSSALR